MAHEVVPRFLDRRINLPQMVKMMNFGFWVSKPFFPMVKRFDFHLSAIDEK
jgi:hypothetical protein